MILLAVVLAVLTLVAIVLRILWLVSGEERRDEEERKD